MAGSPTSTARVRKHLSAAAGLATSGIRSLRQLFFGAAPQVPQLFGEFL